MKKTNQTRRGAKRAAATGSEKAPQRQRRNHGRRRMDRFTEEYLNQPESGIVARSTAPRDVVLQFSESDAKTVLDALRRQNVSGVLTTYVESKISWTSSYNAKLRS